MEKTCFSKQNSLAVKGVAILMMLWHHCFLAGRFEDYAIDFWPLAQSQVVNIAAFCKICVSLFAFISGYGLFLSWKRFKEGGQDLNGWLREKLVRTLSGYWFVVVLAWIVCTIADGRPYAVYGFGDSKYAGTWKMGIEFLGLSNFFGVAKLGEDWWYISAALVFIALLPILDVCLEKDWVLLHDVPALYHSSSVWGMPGRNKLFEFFAHILFRDDICKKRLVYKMAECPRGVNDRASGTICTLFLTAAVLLIYKLYYHLPNKTWWDIKWSIFPLVVILFIYDVLIPLRPVNAVLIFLGRHATNIWLVHAFIRHYYCQDFIYGQGHFALVIGMLFLTSLGLSLVIELLKKVLRYDALVDRLSGRWDRKGALP